MRVHPEHLAQNTRPESVMLRFVALLAIAVSASSADITAHTEMSKVGKSISEALSRVKTADYASKAGRSLLALDASFCGAMTTAVSCGFANAATCSSTTGCVLESGECGWDVTQYNAAEIIALNDDPLFIEMGEKGDSCEALTATQCAADVTCEFEGQCGTNAVWLTVWMANNCPTMATLLAKKLAADGTTQAEVQAEANAAGISVTPEFEAAMNAEGVASKAMALSSALVATIGAAAFVLA